MQRAAAVPGESPAQGGVERDGLLRGEEGGTGPSLSPGQHRGLLPPGAHPPERLGEGPAQHIHDHGGTARSGRHLVPGSVQVTGSTVQVSQWGSVMLLAMQVRASLENILCVCVCVYVCVCLCVCLCVCVLSGDYYCFTAASYSGLLIH